MTWVVSLTSLRPFARRYWDDDYFADGDDERRHFEDWHDDEEKKASTVGYVKSTDPFAVEPDEDTGAAATLLVTALLVTGALLGCCAVVRVARGDRCVVRKGNEKADLAQAWSEMTERQVRDPASHRESRSSFFYDVVPAQDKKKADVPITPDVTFSGAMA